MRPSQLSGWEKRISRKTYLQEALSEYPRLKQLTLHDFIYEDASSLEGRVDVVEVRQS